MLASNLFEEFDTVDRLTYQVIWLVSLGHFVQGMIMTLVPGELQISSIEEFSWLFAAEKGGC